MINPEKITNNKYFTQNNYIYEYLYIGVPLTVSDISNRCNLDMNIIFNYLNTGIYVDSIEGKFRFQEPHVQLKNKNVITINLRYFNNESYIKI